MMMNTTRLGLVFALSTALFACGSNDTGGSTSSGGTSGGTSSGGTSGGTSGSSGASAPAAPKIDAVSQMMNGTSGVLHVKWTNPTAKCESVEAERMAEMADGTMMEKYKVVFTVAGDIDNKMDASATANMKFTYRLRCKVGSQYSPYSNEASGTPKQ